MFKSNNEIANNIGRIAIIADLHIHLALKRTKNKVECLSILHVILFMFVKNLTTAEGGAVTWIINDKSIEKNSNK